MTTTTNKLTNEFYFQNFIFRIVIYGLFQLVRIVVYIESLVWLIVKNLIWREQANGRDPTLENIEIYDVVLRHKFYQSEVSRDIDFVLFHSYVQFISFEEIFASNKWHFYSLNANYAYFVYCEKAYPATDEVSFTTFLFDNAERVGEVKLEDFLKTPNYLKYFNGKTITFTAMPNSSSGDLLSVFQNLVPAPKHDDKCIKVIRDTSSLSSLLNLFENNDHFSLEECRKLALCALRCLLKDQGRNEIWIVEMRPETINLIPHIHAIAPSILHVFFARNYVDQALLYMLKEHEHKDKMLKELLLMKRKMGPLKDFFTWKLKLEKSIIEKVKPENELQLALSMISKSVLDYRLAATFFIVDVIYYETFITEPYRVITRLLESCGLLNQFSVPDIKSIKEHKVKYEFSLAEKEEIQMITDLVGLFQLKNNNVNMRQDDVIV